jgi:hypothetical protein
MDPDVTLDWLRNELKPELLDMEGDAQIEIDGVIQMFQALDEWISRGGFLPKEWVNRGPSQRANGYPRMTDAQRNRLWEKCGDYNVPFNENDYFRDPQNGWVEGWLGGSRDTIYLGVSPEGESHS